MYSTKSSVNSTLSYNVGSTRVPHGFGLLINTKKCRRIRFKQHWNLFFDLPPLVQKLIQAWIDQCKVVPNLDFNKSAITSYLTAPSSSRWPIIMSQQSDHESWLQNNLDWIFSWFNVYPCSFTIRNRHRRQRKSRFSCTSVTNFLSPPLLTRIFLTFRLHVCWFRSRCEPKK